MTQSNAIDVMKVKEDKLLEQLGKADWVIALPAELPDLTITAQWRYTLQEYSGKQFVRWVMSGFDRTFTHDYDPPWDHSGSLRQSQSDPLMLLVRHESLCDWAENEYTGQSRASYMSGMGLFWDTYKEDINDYLEEQIRKPLTVHCMDFWKIEDEWDLFEDTRWDDIEFIVFILARALLEDTLQLSTAEAWKRFRDDIHAENEDRRKQAARLRQMQEQVNQFWQQHFPDLIGKRIELPQFREMGLEERIAEVLADTDPQFVRMVAEMSVPGSYSNSVREFIQQIARRAME